MLKVSPRQLVAIKCLFHLLALLPILYLVLNVMSGNAGGDPVQHIIHYTGMGTLNTLVAVLLISPVAKRFKLPFLMQTRRLVGLWVFAYACLHIMAFLSLDLLFEWRLLLSEVVKRPYILVGASAYLLLLILSITSINRVRMAMGRNWQRVHNSIYLIAILAPIHFYWSVKSEIIEPSLYLVLFVCLLLIRLNWGKIKKRVFQDKAMIKERAQG
ncbi:protein-methionine-sulfoxide reductase heme-binding subunit MsrQ [Shewanella sp. AS1]|uniref:protein-methionine-sulfoxide reductase heme-binding subunit MsrQ n=1 Tax=Shewanella sp. AS1 TaxID=2907626 RepID=UPI001F3E6552|nr:protein-methionine-sulfoxide reductase heme-binding subunit MsrQ [Shewanella sp. AS1]MCE9678819.1 protein-methionine-sulfoxide reductase heme-binding subunit MsrQ [Shewanella sp. AS1]